MRCTRLFVTFILIASGILSACTTDLTPGESKEPYPVQEQPVTEEPYPSPPDTGAVTPQEPYPSPDEGMDYLPVPGDEVKDRGEVYLDFSISDLLLMESYPVQVALTLRGDLPTPCHELRAVVSEPDAENRILVDVYSVVEKDVICTQVLQPFEVRINLGSFTSGKYSVWINGQFFKEFDI